MEVLADSSPILCDGNEVSVENLGNISCAAYAAVRRTPGTTMIFGSYHKTGTILSQLIIKEISGQDPALVVPAMVHRKEHIFSSLPAINLYSDPNLNLVSALPSYRLLHMIRDPVHLVVSAYRYHLTSTEPWLAVPISVFLSEDGASVPGLRSNGTRARKATRAVMEYVMASGSPSLQAALQRAVREGRGYGGLYKMLPEKDGALVEAYRSSEPLRTMVENFQRAASDANTLQVRMESIEANFDDTMRCILRFISKTYPVDVEPGVHRLRRFELSHLDPDFRNGHVTRGKFNNTLLNGFLEDVPVVRKAAAVLRTTVANSC